MDLVLLELRAAGAGWRLLGSRRLSSSPDGQGSIACQRPILNAVWSSRVSLNTSARASFAANGTGRRRGISPMRPRTSPTRIFWGRLHIDGRNGSTVGRVLALRPGFSVHARMPPTACCATRREACVTGVDCGARAARPIDVTPPAWWTRPNLIERAGVLALFLTRGPNRGTGRLEDHDADRTQSGSA